MALALGIFVGTITRSQVFAVFLTLALLVVIRLPVEFGLRPNYAPQITITWPLAQGNTPPVTLAKQDWHIADGFLDAQGNRTDDVYGSGDNQPRSSVWRSMAIAATIWPTSPRAASGPSSGSRRASTRHLGADARRDGLAGPAACRVMR
jgi:hypothetical protein